MKYCLQCANEVTRNRKFCTSSCAATYNNKLRIRKESTNLKVRNSLKDYFSNNQEAVKARSFKYKKTIRERRGVRTCLTCNKEISKINKYSYCKEHWILSEEFKTTTGHNRNYKKGWVYNKWTDSYVYLLSSLEYTFFDYLEKSNIRWEKPKPLKYQLGGKEHLYFPDFYLTETAQYVEVKGYMWNDDAIKMKAVLDQNTNIALVILDKKQLSCLT
jgi:hypothetical protein